MRPGKKKPPRADASDVAGRALGIGDCGDRLRGLSGDEPGAACVGASGERISVHGNVRLSSGEVRAIVDGLRGSSILTADLPRYRRRLLESPWIADVALRRVLPSTVEVFVSERMPMGLCRLGSDVYLIDAHGTIIDQFGPQYAEFDLPIIDGLVRAPSSGEPAIDETRADLAARVIEAVAAARIWRSAVSRSTCTTRTTRSCCSATIRRSCTSGRSDFWSACRAYVDLADALRERVPDMDYVDLGFEDRIYVRPASEDAVDSPAGWAGGSSAPSPTPASHARDFEREST